MRIQRKTVNQLFKISISINSMALSSMTVDELFEN